MGGDVHDGDDNDDFGDYDGDFGGDVDDDDDDYNGDNDDDFGNYNGDVDDDEDYTGDDDDGNLPFFIPSASLSSPGLNISYIVEIDY